MVALSFMLLSKHTGLAAALTHKWISMAFNNNSIALCCNNSVDQLGIYFESKIIAYTMHSRVWDVSKHGSMLYHHTA